MDFKEQKRLIISQLRKKIEDHELIQELTQMVFIKMYTSKHTYGNKGMYISWIKKLVNSVYIDYFRHANSNKGKRIVLVEVDGISEFNSDYKFDLQDKTQRNIGLLEAIDKLPEKQRDVILLRYHFKLDYKKISKLMNCSFNTATSYMNYAKINLKKIYERESE